MPPTPARWTSGGPHTLLEMRGRTLPARRVYHEWDDVVTKPDIGLDAAFELTDPGALPVSFEEETTLSDWILPGLGLLVGGFLLGRWWVGREKTTVASAKSGATAVGDDECGYNMLGAV